MKEIASTAEAGLSRVEQLAMEAHMYACAAGMNLMQLGRVLAEAKPLIPHGAFGEWVETYAHISQRTAEDYMAVWRKFGDQPDMAQLGPSQLIALLPMEDEERAALLARCDVAAMTNRELKAAIRAQREELRAEAMAEAQAAIDAAEEARDDAEARLAELERRGHEADEDALEAARAEAREEARQEIDEAVEGQTHFAEMARKANTEKAQAERERNQARAELDEANDLLREQQEQYNALEQQYRNLQSAQARGDAARPEGDDLTLDVFGRAVREFIGLCARMPYMQTTFGAMPQGEKQAYGDLLRTVEGWAQGARKALESVTVEGGVIVG